MERINEILQRKFLKDHELLELEDYEMVIECKYIKPYNAHYNEYLVIIDKEGAKEEYCIYLKHR